MRIRIILILGLSILTILACDLGSTFSSGASEDSGEEGLSVQEQIEATTRSIETADALIQKGVDAALTAAALQVTDTPEFTSTPVPTDTPAATDTPTATPTPFLTPTIDWQDYSYVTSSGDCKNETARIEIRNNTGEPATLELTMEKSGRTCEYSIFSNDQSGFFWIEPGRYTMIISYCDQVETYSGPLNSGWWFKLKATYCQ